MAPRIEPIQLARSSASPSSDTSEASAPPTNEPAIPNRIVPRQP